MSGCGRIDIDVAKMFWKSFTLTPPIESELFSADIGQRRRTAPPAGRTSSRKSRGDSGRSLNSYNNLEILQIHNFKKEFVEEERRKQTVYETRMQTLMLLDKHRRRRLEKESISESVKPIHDYIEDPTASKSVANKDVEDVKNLSLFRAKTML